MKIVPSIVFVILSFLYLSTLSLSPLLSSFSLYSLVLLWGLQIRPIAALRIVS